MARTVFQQNHFFLKHSYVNIIYAVINQMVKKDFPLLLQMSYILLDPRMVAESNLRAAIQDVCS